MNGLNGRSDLEREADLARARLLGTIDALEQRRHEVFDLSLQLRRNATRMAFTVGGITLGAVVTLGVALHRARRREERLRRERLRALARFWWHPERLAARKRSVLGSAVRTMLLTLTVAAATTAGVAARAAMRRGDRRLPAHSNGVNGLHA